MYGYFLSVDWGEHIIQYRIDRIVIEYESEPTIKDGYNRWCAEKYRKFPTRN